MCQESHGIVSKQGDLSAAKTDSAYQNCHSGWLLRLPAGRKRCPLATHKLDAQFITAFGVLDKHIL